MSFFYSDDPARDAERYYAEQDRFAEQLPECVICVEPVQDDHYWDISDEVVCTSCLVSNYKRNVEDYIA